MGKETGLKDALRRYRRMRSWRRLATTSMIFVGFAVPWFLDFNKTDTLICVAIAAAVWGTGETELRLKTMQIRLAGMEDKLDQLAGSEAEDNLMLELSDW